MATMLIAPEAQCPEFLCRLRSKAGSIAYLDNPRTPYNPISNYHGYRRAILSQL
jgi:hypothetical protein